MFEEQMYQGILSFIARQGYTSFVQVPLFAGKIDFVGVKDYECLVIESKIAHWKKALKQALKYGHGAERVFVALPSPTSKYVAKTYKDTFEGYGVGIIDVSVDANVILDCAVKTPSMPFKQLILNEIEQRKLRSQNRVCSLKERLNK